MDTILNNFLLFTIPGSFEFIFHYHFDSNAEFIQTAPIIEYKCIHISIYNGTETSTSTHAITWTNTNMIMGYCQMIG